MADVRIIDLPAEGALTASHELAVDLAETRKVTVAQIGDVARPFSSQAQAEAGTNNTTTMTPLSGAQQLAALGPTLFATVAEGLLASTALQPADVRALAFKNKAAVTDIDASGSLSSTTFLAGDGTWKFLPGGGNMLSSIYDPGNVGGPMAFAATTATTAQGAKADTALQPSTGQMVFADVATAISSNVPNPVGRIRTQFYSTSTLKGGANYRLSSSAEVANYSARGWFTTNGGTKYWLLDEDLPDQTMFGAVLDGVADDTEAGQDLLDFWSPPAQVDPTTRAQAMAGGGPVLFVKGVMRTTKPLYQPAYVEILGQGCAQFPQSPFTAGGQFSYPNATIIMPDFAPADRALGVCIQTAPYILTLTGASAGLAGQTVGTRFKSLMALEISGTDIDNGCINYCEGSNISNITIWPVNQIFAGIRWTAAAGARLSQVSVRNVNRGIMTESCWESEIHFPRVYDFSDYGIYGGGNYHAVQIYGGWIHAGNRVLNGLSGGVWTVKPVGIYANYVSGTVINSTAVDECFTAIYLQNCSGMKLIGIHSERTLGTWLVTNGGYGISSSGCSMTQNVVDARTYTNSLIWDGSDCSVDLDVVCNILGSGTAANPGKTYFQGTNPNTGTSTNLVFGTGNNVSAIFRNMTPVAADQTRINRLTGNICFINDVGIYQIGGSANSNSFINEVDIKGDANVQRVTNRKVNGSRKFYEIETATTFKVFQDGNNKLLSGYDTADASIFFGGGLKLFSTFGSPETFSDGAAGSLVADTSNFRLFFKTTAAGTLTGWRPLMPHLSGTTAARPTAQLFIGLMYFDTTLNKPIWRNSANNAWVDATGATV